MSWLVPCMAANRCWCVNVCVNGWMRGKNCKALWIKALYKCSPFTIYHLQRRSFETIIISKFKEGTPSLVTRSLFITWRQEESQGKSNNFGNTRSMWWTYEVRPEMLWTSKPVQTPSRQSAQMLISWTQSLGVYKGTARSDFSAELLLTDPSCSKDPSCIWTNEKFFFF